MESRRMSWAGHVGSMGKRRSSYRFLVEKPEGKTPLGRPRLIWEGNMKMDLQKKEVGSFDWINLAQDRDIWRAVVTAVINLRVPQMRGIFLGS
jgi:hypothetical protein